MASRELKVEIIGDASSLNKALGSVEKSSSGLGRVLGKMGKMAAIGLGALGVGAAVAGKRMIDMASDAAEVDSKLQVVFGKTLPGLTKDLDAFSEATGASRYELREQAADMGALLEPLTASKKGAADMSQQFVKLATDLGSFNNVPVADALLAIRSGLVGEAEPLRRFGVLLNATAVEAEGVRLGLAKTGKEMTEQDKVQARASLIMKQTSLAQGDATRTAGSMANQMKALRNNVTDMATSLGTLLIPYALKVAKAFNDNWPTIEKVIKAVLEGIIAGIQGVVTAVNWLREQWEIHRETVVRVWGEIQAAVMRAVDFFTGSILPAIQNVVSAIQAIWARFGEPIMAVLNTVFPLVIQMIKGFVQNVLAPFKILFALLRGDFGAAWDEIKGIFSRAFSLIQNMLRAAVSIWLTLAKALGKAILDGIMAGLTALAGQIKRALNAGVEAIRGMVGAALSAATAVGMAILNGVKNGLSGIAGMLAAQMQKLWDAVKSAAGTAYSLALAIGKAMVQGIIDGFTSLIGSAKDKLVGGVKGIGSAIGGAIGIGSPSRWYADNIGKPMAQGIEVGFMQQMPGVTERTSNAVRTVMREAAKAVTDARATLAAAFKDVYGAAAQAGLDAIDAKFANWVPPALVKLSAAEARRMWDDLNQAVSDATDAYDKAGEAAAAAINEGFRLAQIQKQIAEGVTPTGLTEEEVKATQGMSPEELKKFFDDKYAAQKTAIDEANANVLAALKAKNDAEFAVWAQHQRELGAKQQTHHDKMVAGLKKLFLDRLAVIREAFKNEKPEWQALQNKLINLFEGFGIELGGKFGKGVKDGLIKVGSAVDELATAIANKIAGREGGGGKGEKGKARGGPVFKGGRYIVGEKGPEMFVPKQSGSIMTASQTRRFLRGGGSGGLTKSGKGVGQGESVPAAPKWANESVWQAAVAIAGSMGKLEEFIGAVNSGSYRANAGLLNGIAQNRTRWNWNVLDGWPSVRDAIDMMLPLGQGMSGAEAAEFFGWMKKGGTLPGDGLYYGHKGETVIPLDRGVGQTVIINVSGYVGNERQLARELAPAFMEETRKRQGKGAPPITRVR